MARKYNTVFDEKSIWVGDRLSRTTLNENGDLSLNISGEGLVYNKIDHAAEGYFRAELFDKVFAFSTRNFDISINPWISNYRTLIQILYTTKRK